MRPIVIGSLVALTAASLTANALLFLRYSTSRPLVTVGSQVISKKQYQDALDYQTQGTVLKKLVLQDLVGQAAAREGVLPTEADVNARIQEIQRRTPQELTAAQQDPGKMAQLKGDLKSDLALDNLRMKDVRVTDAEVADYYSRHKKDFALPAQMQTSIVVAENGVDAAQAVTLLRQRIGMDVIARQPRLHVVGMNGYTVNMQALPPALSRRISGVVFRMKPGDVQTIPVGQDYLILRADKAAPAGIPPLGRIKPQVTRLARLEKADPPAVEIARLYQAARPQFNVAKYESYFDDLSQLDVKTAAGKKTASIR